MGADLYRVKTLTDSLTSGKISHRIGSLVETIKEYEGATGTPYPYVHGGIPLCPELYEFVTAVEESIRGVKFLPKEASYMSTHTAHGSGYLTTAMYVYLDGHPYALGHIGVDSDDASKKYVYSRKISNGKYGVHMTKHYTAMSTSLKVAVKNCKKYLVPLTHAELSRHLFKPIGENNEKARYEIEGQLDTACRGVYGLKSRDMLQEFAALKRQGVVFTHPHFVRIANEAESLLEEYQEILGRKISFLFVRIRLIGDSHYIDVSETDARGNSTVSEPTTYTEHNLPEDIEGAISVLNILEDGVYVEGVGKKVDETMFWIERRGE